MWKLDKMTKMTAAIIEPCNNQQPWKVEKGKSDAISISSIFQTELHNDIYNWMIFTLPIYTSVNFRPL